MALSGSDLAYLQARSGIARAGASRSNFVTGLVARVTINGTDRTTEILRTSINITQNLNEQVDTCTMRTRGLSGFTPTAGQTITVSLGDGADNLLFGGRIQAVAVVCRNAHQGGTGWYELYCTDYTWQAQKRLVLKRYTYESATNIVLDLMSTYTSGITTGHVQTSLTSIDDIVFTMTTVPEALTRIANRIGAHWYIDYVGDLHFFTTETRPAPESLTASSSWAWEQLRIRTDLAQVRTRVYVEGRGGVMSDQQTSTFPIDPDIYIDTPSEIFAHPASYGGGTLYARWKTLQLGYTGLTDTFPDQLTGDSGNGALWTTSSEERPREGDEVNQWVIRNDSAAQTALAALEGGDGIREGYVQDRRLNYDGAVARGDAELDLYSDPLITVSYRTQDVNARPGGEVTVSVSSPFSHSGTYRIQSVQINGEDLERSTTQFPWRTVTASSVRFDFYDLLRRRGGTA